MKHVFLTLLVLTLFSCLETTELVQYEEASQLSDNKSEDQQEIEAHTDIEKQLLASTQTKVQTGIVSQTETGTQTETQTETETETQNEITAQAQADNPIINEFHKHLKFVIIPAGKFKMGSHEDDLDRENNENGQDGKQVEVEITRAFEMMETEVTQSLYHYVMGENPSKYKNEWDCDNWDSIKELCPDHPVERLSWKDTQDFIKTLNEAVGLKNCKNQPDDPSGCYRLPTEAEWEWATRAGTETAYFFGDDSSLLTEYAIFHENSGKKTHKVKGNRIANPYGLYDIYGNVQEFVQDSYNKFLPGGKNPLVLPSGWWIFKSDIVIRGGSFYTKAHHLRSATRMHKVKGFKSVNYGFRLVRNL